MAATKTVAKLPRHSTSRASTPPHSAARCASQRFVDSFHPPRFGNPRMRIRFAPALLVVAVTMSSMAPPDAAHGGVVPGTVERYSLDNGLQVVLASDPAAATVDVAVWYDAGTRLEPAGRTGVAHLFEHLMFRGSSRFGIGEHARRITATGGTFGAFTAPDFCSFFDTVPASGLETALELEADRMTGLVIDARRLDAT